MEFLFNFILRPVFNAISRICKTAGQYLAWKAHPTLRLQQSPECHILQLPCELILSICDHLDAEGQILLSETCRCMWELLGYNSMGILAQFSALEHARFQAVVARDYLDWWFCDICMSLHRVELSDNYRSIHESINFLYDSGALLTRVKHRHVQLALKYTRMQEYCKPYHQKCLRRLLAPYRFSKTEPAPIGNGIQPVQCSCYPKVALSQDGRLHYLLLAVLRLPPSGGRAHVAEPVGCFEICPHLMVNRDTPTFEYLVDQRIFEPYGNPYPHVAIAIRDALRKREHIGLCDDINESEEVCDSCPCCPLDFSVRVARSFIEIRIWQDFGPEEPRSNLAWMAHIDWVYTHSNSYLGYPLVRNLWNVGFALFHVPGSVRRFYEQNVKDAELEKGEESWKATAKLGCVVS